MSNVLKMQRGSHVTFVLIWPGLIGPFDLTDWDAGPFEAHPALLPNLTITKGDPLLGEIRGRIEWDDSYINGGAMTFRIQITRGGMDPLSIPELAVLVI